jgi:hypothetical protein
LLIFKFFSYELILILTFLIFLLQAPLAPACKFKGALLPSKPAGQIRLAMVLDVLCCAAMQHPLGAARGFEVASCSEVRLQAWH